MKLIVAIIKPHKLDAVREALLNLGIIGMTASEVKGYGRQRGHTEVYRGAEYTVSFMPKVKIEIVVADAVFEAAIDAIKDAAYSGQIGDGKVFAYPVSHAVRIRTGETDDEAL